MADYLPVRIPGQALPVQASAQITGGQLVEVSGNGTVAKAAAGSTKWLGVAGHDAAADSLVTVHCGGTQELTASGAITAGDLVAAAANGQAATAGATPAAGSLLGVALSTTTAADQPVRVQFNR